MIELLWWQAFGGNDYHKGRGSLSKKGVYQRREFIKEGILYKKRINNEGI